MDYFAQFMEKRGYSKEKLEQMFSFSREYIKGTDEVCSYLHDLPRDTVIGLMSDFDFDGISAGIVGYLCFHLMGFTNLRISDRSTELGYDFTRQDIDKLGDISVLFTSDVGISCHDALSYAKQKGMTVIVTDHHVPDKGILPPADYVIDGWVDPDFLKKSVEICGSYTVYHIFERYTQLYPDECDVFLCSDLELVRHFAAMATIADSMPVLGINRYIVKEMLSFFNYLIPQDKSLAIVEQICHDRVLQNVYTNFCRFVNYLRGDYYSGFNMDFMNYELIPVINSIKRMEADIGLIYRMLFGFWTEDYAEELVRLNQRRKELVNELFESVYEKKEGQIFDDFIYLVDCGPGICGLLAAKIMEQTQMPTVVLSIDCLDGPEGLYHTGSVRSPYDYQFMPRVNHSGFAVCKGHPHSCGITVLQSDLPDLYLFLKGDVMSITRGEVSVTIEDAEDLHDVVINLGENLYDFKNDVRDFYRQVRDLGPFGSGFPAPNILLECDKNKLSVMDLHESHLKLCLSDKIQAMLWNHDMGSLVGTTRDNIIYLSARLSRSVYEDVSYLQFTASPVFN